jgi:hypothetical protein
MTTRRLRLCLLAIPLVIACGGKSGTKMPDAGPTQQPCTTQADCGAGLICRDPLGGTNLVCSKPECSDGVDNDGDGKIDYPDDPGCIAPQQDNETDDCPSGPACPQCSNGKDDDGNGLTDYPNDPGCTSAADPTEFTLNAAACGPAVMVHELPTTLQAMGTFVATDTYANVSPCGGGGSMIVAEAWELHLSEPKVIVASTAGSSVDTVLDIRSKNCAATDSEVACNNDTSATDNSATVTTSLDAGDYYLLVESRNGDVGTYQLNVQEFSGEGTPCQMTTDCGPGLVCRVPMGGSAMVCSKPMCSDGVDDDGDGKADYPDDPGCTDPSDNDEMDDCPSGPMCPECANGKDDDGDGMTDYPADTSCKAASGNSEACNTTEGVTTITAGMTNGDTTGASDDYTPTCASGSGGTDLTYELDLPALTSLSVDVEDPNFNFFPDTVLLGASCKAPELACEGAFSTVTQGPLAAGSYFLVVDGDSAGLAGSFTITVSGTIAGGESCESPLAQSGALVCAAGYTCSGTAGSRTCKPAACNDGMDNDGDGKIDYPNDPGCTSPADDDETDPATAPVCSNGMDDDADGKTDFPSDFGCSSAAGASEVFCSMETDPVAAISAATTAGNLTGLHADLTPDCGFASDNDKTYSLQLPVKVKTLTIDTTGSTVSDTVLELWDAQCTSPGVACNDDIEAGVNDLSSITMSDVAAGNYAVTVKAYDTSTSGAFKLNVKGTLASGTPCGSSLVTAGVLKCDTGLTCSGTPKTCH